MQNRTTQTKSAGADRVDSAHAQGADNVLLDGVFHSMGKIGSNQVSSRPWYGSEEVIDAWAGHLL